MLTLEHFHKEVKYYQSITGKNPERVYCYIYNHSQRRYLIHLLPVSDFSQYEFSGYTYPQSAYPVVKIKR